ncbi:MAG: hypothetical protein ACFFEA_13180 [Candidatus Thorarchaeota archaeon]
MSSRTLYTRRMSRKELDIWLELYGDKNPLDKKLADIFIQLEDSMFFLSSIGNEIVGGTAIYRDRTRLAVALIAAYHNPDLKETGQLQLIKSSLPFFRSVTIHHVDAIVGKSRMNSKLPFPINFVLDKKFRPVLESFGFVAEEAILQCAVTLSSNQEKEPSMDWMVTKDHDAVRNLFWRQYKTTGIDTTLVTLGWQMASAMNHLETLHDEKGITAAVGIERIGNISVIWPIIADFRLIDEDTLAVAIHERVLQTRASEILIPILGIGQKELAKELADQCGGMLMVEEATLLRKQL